MRLGREQYCTSWTIFQLVRIAMWANSRNVNKDEQITHPTRVNSQWRGVCGGWFWCWSSDFKLFAFSMFVCDYSCWRVVVVTWEMLPHSVMHVASYRIWISSKTHSAFCSKRGLRSNHIITSNEPNLSLFGSAPRLSARWPLYNDSTCSSGTQTHTFIHQEMHEWAGGTAVRHRV